LDFFPDLLHYLQRSTLSSLRARLEFRPHITPVPGRSRFNDSRSGVAAVEPKLPDALPDFRLPPRDGRIAP